MLLEGSASSHFTPKIQHVWPLEGPQVLMVSERRMLLEYAQSGPWNEPVEANP